MEHPCFLLPPPTRCAQWLRRWVSAEEIGVRLCEPMGFHHAMARVEDGLLFSTRDGWVPDPPEWDLTDPRWPERCDHCDYEFPVQEGQLFFIPLFELPDGREVSFTDYKFEGIDRAPPGAMLLTNWPSEPKGEDGFCLSVMTSGGVWDLDEKASNGVRWRRVGTPPKISVSPGVIMSNGYEGRLHKGVLIDNGEGRWQK